MLVRFDFLCMPRQANSTALETLEKRQPWGKESGIKKPQGPDNPGKKNLASKKKSLHWRLETSVDTLTKKQQKTKLAQSADRFDNGGNFVTTIMKK